jgi:hypothetical protein
MIPSKKSGEKHPQINKSNDKQKSSKNTSQVEKEKRRELRI